MENHRYTKASSIDDVSLRASIDALFEGVQIIGFDWTYLYLNPSAVRHSRRSIDQLLGRTMMACYPGIEKTELFAALQRVMTRRQPERRANHFVYPDGTTAWFETLIEPVPDGISVLSLDVTADRAAAAAHAAFRERAAFAIEAAAAGIFELDLLTGRMRWSEPTGHMLGQPGTLEGTIDDFRRLIHPDDLAMLNAAVDQAVQGRAPLRAEFRVVWPDGTVHWLTAKGRVSRDATGRPTGLLGIAIDVTPRKQLEQELQHAQKMECLGQLAGSVAHDFNNVLMAILGFTELLAGTFDAADPRAGDVDEIQKAVEGGRRLTEQLRAFSRRQPIEPTLVNVNDVVRASDGMLRQLLGTHLTLVIDLAPTLAPVHADAGQLQQILVNLAVNARDASPDGGRLTIRTSEAVRDGDSLRVRDWQIEAGDYIMLTVSDTGTGMPPDLVERIFEPFFTTKGPEKGTGLGLSTVYGIVRQSHGFIDVASAPGRGTTFTIGWPRADADVTGQSQAVRTHRQPDDLMAPEGRAPRP
jgi:PAS domain S-box-containing protein